MTCYINLERAQAFLIVLSISFSRRINIAYSKCLAVREASTVFLRILYVYAHFCRVQTFSVHLLDGEEAEAMCHSVIHIPSLYCYLKINCEDLMTNCSVSSRLWAR